MMTDEQLIERIRTSLNAEVAGVQPPADLLKQLQSSPTFGLARHLGWPSRLFGALALAVSAAVVVLVVALAVPGHRGASSGVFTMPSGTPDSARSLVARMAIFRRPQTAADRLPASVSAQLKSTAFGSVAIPSLTRLAATFNGGAGRPGGESIYVVIGPGYRRVDIATAVVVTGATGHRYLVTPPEVVDEDTAIQTGGLTPGAVASDNSYVLCGSTWCKGEPLPGGKGVTVAVVPDGVARVKWVFNVGMRLRAPKPGRTLTVYPRVENNVAISRAGSFGLVSATWYGSDGQLLSSYDEAAQQRAEEARQRAAQAWVLRVSVRQPIAAALIKHFALFRRPVPPPAAIKPLPIENLGLFVLDYGDWLNVNQARFVPYPGTSGYWLIPGSKGVSMARQVPVWLPPRIPKRLARQFAARGRLENAGFLASNAGLSGPAPSLSGGRISVLSGGMIVQYFGPHEQTVAGLVPDGNPTVTALIANGTERTVKVIDNVYSITVNSHLISRVTSIIAKDAAGQRITISAGAGATYG